MKCRACGYENFINSKYKDIKCPQCGAPVDCDSKNININVAIAGKKRPNNILKTNK